LGPNGLKSTATGSSLTIGDAADNMTTKKKAAFSMARKFDIISLLPILET
jgi:hypothetical protein